MSTKALRESMETLLSHLTHPDLVSGKQHLVVGRVFIAKQALSQVFKRLDEVVSEQKQREWDFQLALDYRDGKFAKDYQVPATGGPSPTKDALRAKAEKRAKQALKSSAMWADPEFRAKMKQKHLQSWTPERRAAKGAQLKQYWDERKRNASA